MRTKRTEYKHVRLWPDGTPTVRGTRLKVKFIGADYRDGASAEAIQQDYPEYSLAEIHSAIAYYLDHKEQMDREWDEAKRWVEEQRAAWEQTEKAQQLKAKLDAYRQRA